MQKSKFLVWLLFIFLANNLVFCQSLKKGYVLNKKASAKSLKYISGCPYEFFYPSKKQIKVAESMLEKYFQDTLLNKSSFAGGLNEYVRQYIGFTCDGRQIIYFNFSLVSELDDDEKKELKKKPIVKHGGYGSYFNLKYDVSKKSFFDFREASMR